MPTDWEGRYRAHDTPWDKGAPSPGLIDFLESHPQLAREHVLVPGCGPGHDVQAWAQAGFPVTGCDLAPSAIELARQKIRDAGLDASFLTGDFLRDDPPRLFDWIFEHTLFCAIDPGDRDRYTEAVARWLKPGGNYLAVYYIIPDVDGPPFGVTREEIWARFSPHFAPVAEWIPRSYPHREKLELMIWWRRDVR
ncbi:MAG TPA: methyltransferase domain-containing protein [Verrucomicrobiae bacterium]|jgi:SAM-dependent methyltransferase|nr:methyltransferase domain-containing protein [Verrucomicrobiae bacterium]